MTCEVIHTNALLNERTVDKAQVTPRTDVKALLTRMAKKHFGPRFSHVRNDSNVFGFVAVSSSGDTLHLV